MDGVQNNLKTLDQKGKWRILAKARREQICLLEEIKTCGTQEEEGKEDKKD